MNNRTMIKLSASEDCITLRTFSKDCHSPQGFVLTEKELLELEEKRYMTVSDIHSFAKMSLRKSFEQAEILEIEFTWLSDAGGGKVSGRTETVRLSYKKFKSSIKQSREDSMQIKMLSLEESGRPKIEFQSRRNLKAVAETKALRKKLGKFMADHFLRWKGSRQITVYDDFEPYSFFFREQTPYGAGICGESSSTAGRIWKRRTMGYIPDRRGQDKLWCKKTGHGSQYAVGPVFYFFVEKRRVQCVKNKYKGKKEMKNYVNRNRPREQTNEDDPQQALCVRAGGEHCQAVRQRHPGISGKVLYVVKPEDSL